MQNNLGGNRVITGPLSSGEFVYTTVGMRGPLLAIRPPSEGEKTLESATAWKHRKGTPDTPCPVIVNDLLFMVSDNGFARCLDAQSGAERWVERLSGNYRASLFATPERVYILNTTGVCTVIRPTGKFEKLAENRLDDAFYASPAVADGKLFLRGKRALYCVGQGK